MMRVPFDEMRSVIGQAFIRAGMAAGKAEACARIHTESSLDGVYSHGLNRVERFVDYLNRGWVDPDAEPSPAGSMGSMETWDGNLGPGVLNAGFCMERAVSLAASQGMGWVNLRNTTHWMRGGSYGWQAVEKGMIALCWTNTESCMPPWGARSCAIGNNPLVIAIPNPEGHLVLDMAMSQFSYGKLQVTRLRGEKLPYAGGFDAEGRLTDDPLAIESSRRILPTGFWKGSGLAIMLDLLAALLSGGLSTAGIDKKDMGSCGGCCQVFIAVDPARLGELPSINAVVSETVGRLKQLETAEASTETTYPGERSVRTRMENMSKGIPVDEEVWKRVRELAGVIG